MSVSPLYLVRRCDAFYRYWHDVTTPAPLRETSEAYDRLTGGGARNTTSESADYYEIFPADRPPGWTGGGPPLIRRLHRRDAAGIEAHLLGLSIADRHLRFFRGISDLQLSAYVAGIDWSRSLLVGAILEDRIIGLGEAVFDREALPRRAEIAVSVEAAYRRMGLGRHLIRQAADHAELLGVPRPHLLFLRENRPLRNIVRALGGRVMPDEAYGGEVLGVLGAAGAPLAV